MSTTSGHYTTIPGLTVGSDLSGKQYMFVKMASTANQIIAVSATTDTAIGVLLNAPDASGEAAMVAGLGVVPIIAGTSTITAGEKVGWNTTGQAVDGNAANAGLALEDSGASGDSIRVLLAGLQ